MIHEKLFIALLRSSSAHAEASRREFYKLGLTEGQPKILYKLHRQDGQVQKDLAAVCGVKESTLAVLLAKLENQNFIRKEVCYVSGMKRAYKIFLTEYGRDMSDRLEDVVEELEKKGFSGFTAEERETLLSLLSRVEENMKK